MNQSTITNIPDSIHLQAIDLARNIARDYHIEASIDLFGHWIIDLHWGRIGTRGQNRRVSFSEPQASVVFVRAALRRRSSSKRRIGVAYQPVRGDQSSSSASPDLLRGLIRTRL